MLQSAVSESFKKGKGKNKGMARSEPMLKFNLDPRPALSRLSDSQMRKYEGKFIIVSDDRVVFSGKNAKKVLAKLDKVKGDNLAFTCIPKRDVVLVK